MNKKTRTFIWGLILIIVCCIGLSSVVAKGDFTSYATWVKAILIGFGAFSGGVKINKTTM